MRIGRGVRPWLRKRLTRIHFETGGKLNNAYTYDIAFVPSTMIPIVLVEGYRERGQRDELQNGEVKTKTSLRSVIRTDFTIV